jgi:hypothetical protein
MQEINIKKEELTPIAIYEISKNLEYLRLATNSRWNVVFEDRFIYNKNGSALILGTMIWVRDWLNKLNICQNEVYTLDRLIREFEEFYTNSKNPIGLTDYHANELSKLIARIEAVFIKELKERKLIEVSFSGILNYREILKNGFLELFNDKDVVSKIPPSIRDILDESVRALLYNIPMASAMLSIKAVEDSIRELYISLKGKECNKIWEKLEEIEEELKSKNLEFKKLCGYLYYLKNIKNDIQLKNKIFTKKESEYILIHAIYAIEETYKIIVELSHE